MESDRGRQMGKAIRALLEMQEDCIRLFHDLDKAFPQYKSLYGNVVTLNQGNSISRRRYVAEGLIRLYVRAGQEDHVLGINICFHDGGKLEEPLFVAANTRYRSLNPDKKEFLEMGWDPWTAFLEWTRGRVYGTPVTVENPSKRPTIAQITVAAAPLYAITSIGAALQIIEGAGRP